MARTEARIKTAIWHDDFTDLDIIEQWAYFVVLSQSTLNLCGVTPYTPGRWSNLAKDATATKLRKAISALGDKVVVDEGSEELWVRTFVKHDGVLDKAPNLIVSMTRDFGAIQSKPIRHLILDQLGEGFPEWLRQRFPKPFEEGMWQRFGKPFRQGYEERFNEGMPYPCAATRAEPHHPINPSPNGTRCGSCGNRGYVEIGAERASCPANCPHAVCKNCLGTRFSDVDENGTAVPCPDCQEVR